MSFIPNVGSLALSPRQEYGCQVAGTTPADASQLTPLLTASYPNVAGDLTIPGVGDPGVITVNNSGLYSCFFSAFWLTHNSATGYRWINLADGDGNYLWAEIRSEAEVAATNIASAHTTLLWLPAGLALTFSAKQNGGSTEDVRIDVDIFRML